MKRVCIILSISLITTLSAHASFKKPATLKEAIEQRQNKKEKRLSNHDTADDLRQKQRGDVFYISLSLVRMGISSFPMEAFKRFQKTRNLQQTSPLPYNKGSAARNTNTPFRVVLGPQKKFVVFIDDYFDLFEDFTQGATTIPVRIVRDDSVMYDAQTFWAHLRDDGLVDFIRPRPQTFINHSPGVSGNMTLAPFNLKQHHTLYAQDVVTLAQRYTTIDTLPDDLFASNLAALMPKITVYTQPPFIRVYGYVKYPAAVRIDPRVHDIDNAIKSGSPTLHDDKQRQLSAPDPARSGHRPIPQQSTWEKIKGFFSFSDKTPPHVDTLLENMAPALQYRIEQDEVARNNPRERDPAILNMPDLMPLLTENNPPLDKDQIARLQTLINEAYHHGDFNHIPYINDVLVRLDTLKSFDAIPFRDFIDTHQQLETFDAASEHV